MITKTFDDFDDDILADIIRDGYGKDEIPAKFKKRKRKMISSFRTIAEETIKSSKAMTKEALAAEIGL